MDLKKFYGICLQGDVLGAIEYLGLAEGKDEDILRLKKRFEERFISESEIYNIKSEDVWVREVVSCYLRYFKAVLTGGPVEVAEKELTKGLLSLVGGSLNDGLDEVELLLGKGFEERGYTFLGGTTGPYRGPYVWRNTRKERFEVTLPESVQEVNVYFISDFVMEGWVYFATMGRHYAGGWAKPEGLYYVDHGVKPIDMDSDWFQMTFLKHEAQHLDDFEKFPHLNSKNLEYRAKLVELIYYPESYEVVEKFLNEAKDDEAFPHSYAAYRIIEQLSSLLFDQSYVEDRLVWKRVLAQSIRCMALEIFLKNNKELLKAGIEVEGVI